MINTRLKLPGVLLLSALAGAFACSDDTSSSQFASQDPDGNADGTGDSNCDTCWAEFEECLGADGTGDPDRQQECRDAMENCLRLCEPPPPNQCDSCWVEFDECAGGHPTDEEGTVGDNETGDDGSRGECQQRLEMCLADCEPPPPPVCQDDCYRQWDECLGNPQTPDGSHGNICDDILNQCLRDCDDIEPPQEPCEFCFVEFEECLAGRGSDDRGEECHHRLQACLSHCEPQPPVDDCEQMCFIQHDECTANCRGNRGHMECEWQLDECLRGCHHGCNEPPRPWPGPADPPNDGGDRDPPRPGGRH